MMVYSMANFNFTWGLEMPYWVQREVPHMESGLVEICWAFNSLYKRSGLLLFACKHSIYKSKFLQSYNLRPEQTGTKKRNKDEWKYSETVRSSLNFSQQNCNPFPKIRASWYIKRRCKQKTKTLHFSVNLSIWSMRVLKVSNSCWKLNSISIY